MSQALATTTRELPSSPEHVRLSLAAAMTLGLAPGIFYRNARLGCINLLLIYPGGCKANCAYCGLARENLHRADPKFEKFIRVAWHVYPLEEVIQRYQDLPPWVERSCISMITHPSARADTLSICRQLVTHTSQPVSLLIAPTLVDRDWLLAARDAGADRIGVAIDAATPGIFARLRGKGVRGPHRWERYWQVFEDAIEVFGENMVGAHFIYGLGETERELVEAMERARVMGGSTHLFCFFPERYSAMAATPQPPASGYRRIQLARWLIDHDKVRVTDMSFDEQGRIVDFGLAREALERIINSGEPFMTSGCPGRSGKVACNRPYGNEKPGPDIRNYPFKPLAQDLELIRSQLWSYE